MCICIYLRCYQVGVNQKTKNQMNWLTNVHFEDIIIIFGNYHGTLNCDN